MIVTLLLCASTHHLMSGESSNLIQPEDLQKDLIYIDEFLTTVHGMHSTLLPEEVELIKRDLTFIDRNIEQVSEHRNTSYLQKIMAKVKEAFERAQKYEKELKELEKPNESTEIKPITKKISSVIKKRATSLLTKKQGKKEEKLSSLKARNKHEMQKFEGFLSSSLSSSTQPIAQPKEIDIKPYQDPLIVQLKKDIKMRKSQFEENISTNRSQETRTEIFIKNNTDSLLTIQYTPKNGTRALTQEIAPGQTSRAINRNNIKTLSCRQSSESHINIIDISKITKSFITVNPKRSFNPFSSGSSYNIEQKENLSHN